VNVWRYAWTLAPLLSTVALGVNLIAQSRLFWIGGAFTVVGVLGLMLVILRDLAERAERAHAFYVVDGPRATYLYSFTEFRRLPESIRRMIRTDNPDVERWYQSEQRRHGIEIIEALAGGRWQKLRYRTTLWLLNFLT
jgi:hypothetical protein